MTDDNEIIGITAFGGYVPRLRFNPQAVVDANAWFNPGLQSLAKGERAFCNWDEDSLTIAIEAARDCLADRSRKDITALFVASTTLPFSDRQNAAIAATALNLNENLHSLGITSSQRAGTSGLLTSLKAQRGQTGIALFIATEKRTAPSASAQELRFGDGAAALLLGSSDVIAKFFGR